MAVLRIDVSNETAGMAFKAIPKGVYQAHVIDSEMKESKSGNKMLSINWMILDGEFRGRQLFDFIMFEGNENAVKLGRVKLKTMAVAMNFVNPNVIKDSEEFHGKPCLIHVGIRTSEEFGEQNRILEVEALPGKTASPPPITNGSKKKASPPPPAVPPAEQIAAQNEALSTDELPF